MAEGYGGSWTAVKFRSRGDPAVGLCCYCHHRGAVIAMKSERTFMPAAGRDAFLPLYDPLTKLFGSDGLNAALLDQSGLQPHFRVLDVGCGTGTLAVRLKRLHPTVEVVGLDPDPKALARARRKAVRAGLSIQFDPGFSDALPYETSTFDRVFSSMMFHHVRKHERESTLREIRRVLKPGGRLEFVDFASSGSHAHGLLARMLHPQQQLRTNADDRLLGLMTRASFSEARKVGDRSTLFGTVAFYQAVRPA
jgi:SAM-dependent methyltransferase